MIISGRVIIVPMTTASIQALETLKRDIDKANHELEAKKRELSKAEAEVAKIKQETTSIEQRRLHAENERHVMQQELEKAINDNK